MNYLFPNKTLNLNSANRIFTSKYAKKLYPKMMQPIIEHNVLSMIACFK